jgi:hypothetical protein
MRVWEAIAAGFVRFGHVRSEHNIADIMTKPLGPSVFHRLAHPYLFRHLNSNKDDNPKDVLNAPVPYRHYTQPTSKKRQPHALKKMKKNTPLRLTKGALITAQINPVLYQETNRTTDYLLQPIRSYHSPNGRRYIISNIWLHFLSM